LVGPGGCGKTTLTHSMNLNQNAVFHCDTKEEIENTISTVIDKKIFPAFVETITLSGIDFFVDFTLGTRNDNNNINVALILHTKYLIVDYDYIKDLMKNLKITYHDGQLYHIGYEKIIQLPNIHNYLHTQDYYAKITIHK